MATFDKSKVITGVNAEQAVIEKKYWFADHIGNLKGYVENNICDHISILKQQWDIQSGTAPFVDENGVEWECIYPCEESVLGDTKMIDLEKETKVDKLKNVIVNCMSLVDRQEVSSCLELMASTYKELTDKSCTPEPVPEHADTDLFVGICAERIEELNGVCTYISATAYYMDGCRWGPDKGLLEEYVDHVCEQHGMDNIERMYVASRIVYLGEIACSAGSRVVTGIARSLEW